MKQKEVEFPENWDEVTSLEWLRILKLRENLSKQPELSLLDVKRQWAMYALKTRGYRFKSKVDDMLLIDELSKTLDWMWHVNSDESGTAVELIYDSTVNLLPTWQLLHGPANHGADMTFGEFRHAVTAMNKYTVEQSPIDLRALCAILYRKPIQDKGCFHRKPFRQQSMSQYMGMVRWMPEFIQWGVYAWFAYFCEYLFSGTFIIDGLELSFAPVFERQKKYPDAQKSAQSLGMVGVLHSVAEGGIFGNVDATDDTLLLRVMMKLLDDKQRADEMMRNLKK